MLPGWKVKSRVKEVGAGQARSAMQGDVGRCRHFFFCYSCTFSAIWPDLAIFLQFFGGPLFFLKVFATFCHFWSNQNLALCILRARVRVRVFLGLLPAFTVGNYGFDFLQHFLFDMKRPQPSTSDRRPLSVSVGAAPHVPPPSPHWIATATHHFAVGLSQTESSGYPRLSGCLARSTWGGSNHTGFPRFLGAYLFLALSVAKEFFLERWGGGRWWPPCHGQNVLIFH